MSKDKDTSRMKKLLGLSTTMPVGAAGGGFFSNILGGPQGHHGHSHGAGCGCSHGHDDDVVHEGDEE